MTKIGILLTFSAYSNLNNDELHFQGVFIHLYYSNVENILGRVHTKVSHDKSKFSTICFDFDQF